MRGEQQVRGEPDKKRKPDNQMNQQPAKKQCNLWRSWEQDGSGVRGIEQQVRGEQQMGDEQQQVRGEPEKNPQQRGGEPESEQQMVDEQQQVRGETSWEWPW